ncbi:hypothetical protein CHLRE_12g561350v5 [Chlamydomonas reinhardtii]|uniref:MYND-type domain-containing protein n=1 Tax=Chlamydomonas reinhardtii TaxID=3055 RepID=A0A2K3D5G5_CHLRE|nr:uncharacterized protein CHLRE_12g561350v5 [Chlamydomonas reinhardtii]PNW75768.1 hypothetical protein CHLRE_12g561350v5 [Chlamydomonas reinhardtii]
MSGATKEGAVKIGQLFLFAHHLTSGWMTVHAMLMSRIWQAARHVERLAGARFAFVEVPASGLGAPANTRRVTEVDCEEAVARWMRTGNGPFTAMKPHQEAVDPQLYMHMSADEFVLVLCALYCSNRGNKPVAFKLATNLLSSAAVQTRIREVLVPRVAARGAGQTWKMSAEQLESVWLTECMLGLLEGVAEGAVPAGSDAAVQARKVLVAAGVRMEELQPHCGPLVLSVSIRAATGAGDTATVCRLSALMARLGDEAGNDLAAATGHYATISNILSGKALGTSGAGGRNPYPLCKLRAMLAKANAAERRLARWNMGTVIVDNVSTQMLTTLRDSMAELAHLPDTAEIHLPYKLGRGDAPAASARPASGAAATATAAAAAGAQSSTRGAASATSPASAPAASCSQAGGASASAAPAAVGNKACHGCGMALPRLQKCSRCRQRWYCSEACQVKDWRAGHKAECKRLAAEAGAEAEAAAK